MLSYKGRFNTLQSSAGTSFYLRLQNEDGDEVLWYRWISTGYENVSPHRVEHLETLFHKENKE